MSDAPNIKPAKARGNGATVVPPPVDPVTPDRPRDVFDDLDALRVEPEAGVGSKKLLTHLAVGKPRPLDFVRAHPDVCIVTSIFMDAEGSAFFVRPELRDLLEGHAKPVLLTLAVTRQHKLFLWPVPLPDPTGKSNEWHTSHRGAYEAAKTEWTRMTANRANGEYDTVTAEGVQREPNWPDLTIQDAMRLAFKFSQIDSIDHPVMRALRGAD